MNHTHIWRSTFHTLPLESSSLGIMRKFLTKERVGVRFRTELSKFLPGFMPFQGGNVVISLSLTLLCCFWLKTSLVEILKVVFYFFKLGREVFLSISFGLWLSNLGTRVEIRFSQQAKWQQTCKRTKSYGYNLVLCVSPWEAFGRNCHPQRFPSHFCFTSSFSVMCHTRRKTSDWFCG